MNSFVFRLYLANESPNSVCVLANLKAFSEKHLPGRHRIEVVDVLKEPARALTDGVLVTPTLVRIAPTPAVRVIGVLNDSQALAGALGLPRSQR